MAPPIPIVVPTPAPGAPLQDLQEAVPVPVPVPVPLGFEDIASAAQLEADKHRARAERFNSEYVPPKDERLLNEVNTWQAEQRERYSRKGDAFVTGIDFASPDEIQKREARAAKYGVTAEPTPTPAGPAPGIPHADDPEEAARRKMREERFGPMESAPEPTMASAAPDDDGMDVDTLEPPREPPAHEAIRPDAVHLYGVDMLNNNEVLSYFLSYGPSYVEWIDDSSCNVVFPDAGGCARALAGRGKPIDEDGGDSATAQTTGINRAWHRGPDFMRGKLAVPLMYRMATVADVRPELRGEKKEKSRRLWRATPTEKKNRNMQFKLTGALAPKAGVKKRRGGKGGGRGGGAAVAMMEAAVVEATAEEDKRLRKGGGDDDDDDET